MRKRTSFSIYPLLIIGIFFLLSSSCEKDDDINTASDNPIYGETTAVFNSNVVANTNLMMNRTN